MSKINYISINKLKIYNEITVLKACIKRKKFYSVD